MNTFKLIALIVTILLFIIFWIAVYYGAFTKLNVEETTLPSYTIVVKKMQGAYKQSPKAMNEVYYYLLNELDIETYKGIGIYYDNPQTTPDSQLQREAGSIIEEKDIEKLINLEWYEVKTLEQKETMLITYPYKGMLSTIISLMRVYPKLNEYAQSHNYIGGPTIEISDIPGKTIYYYQEIL